MSSPARSAVEGVRVTRVEEKRELRTLNDRLASYVEHNKFVEGENERLRKQLEDLQQSIRDQVQKVTREYKSEMKQLKRSVTSAQQKHGSADMENARLRAENKSLREQLAKMNELREDNRRIEEQLRISSEEYAAERTKVKQLEMELGEVQKLLADQETIITKKEEELSEAQQEVDTMRVDIAKVGEAKQEDLERRVEERLREEQAKWQKHSEDEMAKLEQELRTHFENTTVELRKRADDVLIQNTRLQKTLEQTGNNDKELKRQIAELQRTEIRLEQQLTDLSRRLMEKEKEFNDLMDVKISLQNEIDQYRAILDLEEQRTHFTPTKRKKPDSGETPTPEATSSRVTKKKRVRRVRSSSKKKKKRRSSSGTTTTETTETTVRSVPELTNKRSSSMALGGLDLLSDCVVVQNDTDEPVSMKGWTLLSKTGSQTYKFPDDLVVAPRGRVTVWSGRHAESHHNPPTDLFWTRRFIWNNHGDTAVLVNAEGEQVSEITGVPGHTGKETDDEDMGAGAAEPARPRSTLREPPSDGVVAGSGVDKNGNECIVM